MYPVLFQAGKLTIHSFAVLVVPAVLLTIYLSWREASKEKIDTDLLLEAALITLFFGLLGARLLFIALNPATFSLNFPLSLFSRFAGLSFFGELLSGLFALYCWSRKRKVSFLKMGDLFALGLMPGYALGKIGCFLNGCCPGKETALPWALPAYIGEDVLRHPAALYGAAGALLIYLALKLLWVKKPVNGFVLIAMLTLFGLLNLLTGFFTAKAPALLNLDLNQLAGLLLTLFTLTLLVIYFYLLPAEERPRLKLLRVKKTRKYRRGRKFR